MKFRRNKDGSFEMSKDVKASCDNCRFVYYEDDKFRTQKCSLAGRYNKHPVNPDAKKALDEKGLEVHGYCEHHILADVVLDRGVVY